MADIVILDLDSGWSDRLREALAVAAASIAEAFTCVVVPREPPRPEPRLDEAVVLYMAAARREVAGFVAELRGAPARELARNPAPGPTWSRPWHAALRAWRRA